MENNIHPDRRAELMSLILPLNNNYHIDEAPATISAIYYCKAAPDIKKELLLRYVNDEAFPDFIEVIRRLQYPDILEKIIQEHSSP